jgi:hypothetical protein
VQFQCDSIRGSLEEKTNLECVLTEVTSADVAFTVKRAPLGREEFASAIEMHLFLFSAAAARRAHLPSRAHKGLYENGNAAAINMRADVSRISLWPSYLLCILFAPLTL